MFLIVKVLDLSGFLQDLCAQMVPIKVEDLDADLHSWMTEPQPITYLVTEERR